MVYLAMLNCSYKAVLQDPNNIYASTKQFSVAKLHIPRPSRNSGRGELIGKQLSLPFLRWMCGQGRTQLKSASHSPADKLIYSDVMLT